jgi:hypothetical protein
MSTINWTTHPFIESFKKEGLEEGLAEGRKECLAEGKAEDVLKLIDARGIKVTEEERGQVTASAGLTNLDNGLTNLDKWFDRALTAMTAEDISATEALDPPRGNP